MIDEKWDKGVQLILRPQTFNKKENKEPDTNTIFTKLSLKADRGEKW